MTPTLPQKRKGKIVQQCQDLLENSSASIRELSQLIGSLAYTNRSPVSTSAVSNHAAATNFRIDFRILSLKSAARASEIGFLDIRYLIIHLVILFILE